MKPRKSLPKRIFPLQLFIKGSKAPLKPMGKILHPRGTNLGKGVCSDEPRERRGAKVTFVRNPGKMITPRGDLGIERFFFWGFGSRLWGGVQKVKRKFLPPDGPFFPDGPDGEKFAAAPLWATDDVFHV